MQNRRNALGLIGTLGLGAFSLGLAARPLLASDVFDVSMRNVDPSDPSRRMVFTPDLLIVRKGAQVRFHAPEGAHNTQSTPGMVPVGAEGWRFGIRKSGVVTFSKPGFYGYHCLPHRSMGMVGLIIVEGIGMRDNLRAAKSVNHPGKAAERWADLWERAEKLI